MSHFYGTLRGDKGEIKRQGHMGSGLETYAAGWGGAVKVRVYFNSDADEDWAIVTLGEWLGRGECPAAVLYNGPLSHYAPSVGG